MLYIITIFLIMVLVLSGGVQAYIYFNYIHHEDETTQALDDVYEFFSELTTVSFGLLFIIWFTYLMLALPIGY